MKEEVVIRLSEADVEELQEVYDKTLTNSEKQYYSIEDFAQSLYLLGLSEKEKEMRRKG